MTRVQTFRFGSMLLAATVVVAGPACAPSPASPDPATSVSLTLAPGQTETVGALSLTFVGVVDDHRCPGDATCIQAGDAIVALRARTGAEDRTVVLQLYDTAYNRGTVGDYVISLDAVSPYPFVTRPIAPGDYRIDVSVGRRQPR